MTFLSGPINIEQGNSAFFTLEFQSSTGDLITPSTATLTVAYTNLSNASQTDSVSLTLADSFWCGTWSSTSAALGLATWTATSGVSTATGQGQIRVIQRQSTY